MEGAAISVVFNCLDATTTTGTAARDSRIPGPTGWMLAVTNRHNAAFTAFSMSPFEATAHIVSNPLYVPIRANIVP